MCCFSREVESVSNTRIFARPEKLDWQYLVYSMAVSAPEELAMVLPIPMRSATSTSCQFINLEGYPTFFGDLERGFPKPPTNSLAVRSRSDKAAGSIEVQSVGSYEASFVPRYTDFSRLDARFQLPQGTWQELPEYKRYGFAVFKLKPGAQKVHPMAFRFHSSLQGKIFFPTVHIHDGRVHARAGFDHTLYFQLAEVDHRSTRGWAESPELADSFVKLDKTQGIVNGEGHVYRRRFKGRLKNEDIVV